MTNKAKPKETTKPFFQGKPTDENTTRQALKFFGGLLLFAFMTFLVCSMTNFDSPVLRIAINVIIETLVLYIFYTRGMSLGTEGVSRGEILYQHMQKGEEAEESEKRVPFHKAKGFVIGLLGTIPFVILAIVLALTTTRQMTGSGTLPSWTEAYMRRSEIGDALASYTQGVAFTFADGIRIAVRLALMPFISMCGAENKDIILIVEKLSPVLVLLPALAYGIGYLQGPAMRKRVHTEIAANRRKRMLREKRERKARIAIKPKEPEQLN